MKEADYILATDIRALGCAKQCLDEICQANATAYIPVDEWQTVQRLLVKWQQAMYDELRKRRDAEG